MTDYVVVSILPDSRVQLNLLSTIDGAFEQWRSRWKCSFLPVAVFPVEKEKFLKAAPLLQLPAVKTIEWAAARFHSTPIVQEWQFEVTHHIKKQGVVQTVPLLLDWQRAVLAKEVVAA